MVDIAAGYKSRDGMQFVLVNSRLPMHNCHLFNIGTCNTTAPVQSSTVAVVVNNYYEIIIHNSTKYES